MAFLVVASLFAATWAAPAPASATPARYVFEMCDSALPGGGDSGIVSSQKIGRWEPVNSVGPWEPVDSCAKPGGSLSIHLNRFMLGPASSAWGLPIGPPPGGQMEGTTVTAASCPSAGARGEVLAAPWASNGCQEESRLFNYAPDFSGFKVELACGEICLSEGSIQAHYFATLEDDPVPPSLSGLGGSLLDGDLQRGHQSLSASARDVGGGVSVLYALVNGVTAAEAPSSCKVAHTHNPSVEGLVAAAITPCPTAATASWSIDTGAYPFRGGANSVAVCASDFATLGDPNTTCSPAQTVSVDNSCTESPAPGGADLSASFAGSHEETETIGFGRSAKVTGRLTSAAGEAIAGATLCVKSAIPGIDSEAQPVATLRTGADGHYAYEIPPGPNRAVLIGYRHDSFQLAREVRLFAQTRPSIHADPPHLRNGQSVHFWGRLPGPRRRGRVVVLQANVLGAKRWITFRRATSGRRGLFKSSYRFNSTTRTSRYRFRAVVPRQRGYPWVEGHSDPVLVLVRK